jgi:hypothetical protein
MKQTTYDENSPTPKSIIFPTTKITTPWTRIWDYPKLQKLNECYSSHQLSLKKLVNLKYKMKLNIQLVQKGSLIIGVNSLLWTVRE